MVSKNDGLSGIRRPAWRRPLVFSACSLIALSFAGVVICYTRNWNACNARHICFPNPVRLNLRWWACTTLAFLVSFCGDRHVLINFSWIEQELQSHHLAAISATLAPVSDFVMCGLCKCNSIGHLIVLPIICSFSDASVIFANVSDQQWSWFWMGQTTVLEWATVRCPWTC